MISNSQIFIVVDIEADGPAVGLNSMLSIAAVATTEKEEVAHFYRKLATLPGAAADPSTMVFWGTHEEAWREAISDPAPPKVVMTDFYDWILALRREPIFVAYPIGLDYTFVSWYLYRFAPSNPFKDDKGGLRTLDIKSYMAGKLRLPYNKARREFWPRKILDDMPAHTHNALDDAVGHALILRSAIALDDNTYKYLEEEI